MTKSSKHRETSRKRAKLRTSAAAPTRRPARGVLAKDGANLQTSITSTETARKGTYTTARSRWRLCETRREQPTSATASLKSPFFATLARRAVLRKNGIPFSEILDYNFLLRQFYRSVKSANAGQNDKVTHCRQPRPRREALHRDPQGRRERDDPDDNIILIVKKRK